MTRDGSLPGRARTRSGGGDRGLGRRLEVGRGARAQARVLDAVAGRAAPRWRIEAEEGEDRAPQERNQELLRDEVQSSAPSHSDRQKLASVRAATHPHGAEDADCDGAFPIAAPPFGDEDVDEDLGAGDESEGGADDGAGEDEEGSEELAEFVELEAVREDAGGEGWVGSARGKGGFSFQ